MIREITQEAYPDLHHLFHATAAQRTLDAVYGVMCGMENAIYVSQAGVLFFAISERYLIHWWDMERKGAPLGSLSTWHNSLIFLIHIGL